jgi:hypothetical protein
MEARQARRQAVNVVTEAIVNYKKIALPVNIARKDGKWLRMRVKG